MQPGFLKLAIILGLMSCVGPFAIDMYLPALPTIAQDLGVGETHVQATITSYFFAFGIAQLFYGPWADASGRKPPVITGLALFALGSVGAALSDGITALIAWRFVQGIGGAAMMVVVRAIIRDLYTGAEATKLMALIMLVISVSPMLAPLAGSGVIALGSWRWVFWVLVGASGVSLLMALTLLPETLAQADRQKVSIRQMVEGTRRLFADPGFMGLTFIGAFGISSFFVFLSSASFVYSGQYGLTPTQFSLAFAANAIGFFAASQAAGPLGARLGITQVIGLGCTIFAGFAVLLVALIGMGYGSLFLVIGLLFLANAGLGLVIPTTMVMALDDHGDIAGLASSLGGALQMITGGAVVVAASPIFDGTALPMAGVIAACAVISLLLSLMIFRRQRRIAG